MNVRERVGAAVAAVCLVAILCGSAHAGFPYVGLYADTTHSSCQYLAPAPFSEVEMWVWWLPDPVKGMNTGEFRIEYPPSTLVIPSSVYRNPLIVAQMGSSLATGVTFTVTELQCERGWFWSHRQTLVVKTTPSPTQNGWVRIVADPHLPQPPYAIIACSCELGSPEYVCTKLSDLSINTCCAGSTSWGLPLTHVIPRTLTQIGAFFDSSVFSGCGVTEAKKYFRLYPKAASADTLIIAHAVEIDGGEYAGSQYDLTLAGPLIGGTTYVLEARRIHDCDCSCCFRRDSQYEFSFDATISTFLQSSFAALRGSGIEVAWELSSVDDGVGFSVSRSENGGDFRALDASGLVREGLKFTYIDRSVEPGRSYSYKVEYGAGAPTRTLFISGAVSTPSMPLTLYQNKPNPFNPSTAISFYLPDESTVRLDVYDISGRIVSRLIAGERRGAGTHQIEWNGRDSRGAAVSSGIYFYRLTAGKETISKKMVLLK